MKSEAGVSSLDKHPPPCGFCISRLSGWKESQVCPIGSGHSRVLELHPGDLLTSLVFLISIADHGTNVNHSTSSRPPAFTAIARL